jgi:Na+-transporting NADH:ubiquinone oxidoreductase subunit NqrD
MAFAILVVANFVYSKLSEIGNEKSQTISMISKSLLIYNMTWTLLPIHKFSSFYLYEVKDRMSCFENSNYTECIAFCNEKNPVEGIQNITEKNAIFDMRYACYTENKVPFEMYVSEKC